MVVSRAHIITPVKLYIFSNFAIQLYHFKSKAR